MRILTLLGLCILSASPLLAQQAGALDPYFNGGDLGHGIGDGADAVVYAVHVQPDGKVLFGGPFLKYNYVNRQGIARANADGTLDSSFDPGSGAYGWVLAITSQPDGKILIGGTFTSYDGEPIKRIARLNADGSRDTGFNVGTGANGSINAIAVQADGKVLIGGDFSLYNDIPCVRIARLNTDGSLDTGFNTGTGITGSVKAIAVQDDGAIILAGGISMYDGDTCTSIFRVSNTGVLDPSFDPGSGPTGGSVNRVVIQPDQRILLAGQFDHFNGAAHEPVARLSTDGSLDPTFVPADIYGNWLTGLGLRPDGKIMVGGPFYQVNGVDHRSVIRLNADGSLDPSFNTGSGAASAARNLAVYPDGQTIVTGDFEAFNARPQGYASRLNEDGSVDLDFNPQTGLNAAAVKVLFDAQGRIIVVGRFGGYNAQLHPHIARLLADGSADPTFDATGLDVNGYLSDAFVQPDGRIGICGFGMNFTGGSDVSTSRLNEDGSQDQSFDPHGVDGVSHMALQPDGRIVLAGAIYAFDNVQVPNIIRVNADGSLDDTFDAGTGPDYGVNDIALQADGKVLMVGSFDTINGIARHDVARLNADGSVDTSFDAGTGCSCYLQDVSLQADGKVLVAGSFSSFNGVQRRHVVRLNTDGSVDTGFNSSVGANAQVYAVTEDPQGRILIGGSFDTYGGVARPGIARLNADGSLDASFDPGAGCDYEPSCFAVQPDEMIIVGGNFTSYDGIGRNRIARIFGAPSTSSPEAASPDALRAWPNPVLDVLNLSGRVDAVILDAQGRPVRTVAKRAAVPLEGLAPGVYMLRSTDGRSVRFVKD